LTESQPSLDISESFEVITAFLWFVDVPGNVGLNGVEAARDYFLDRRFPGIRMLAEIMEGTGNVAEELAVHLEFVADDFESAGGEGEGEEGGEQWRGMAVKKLDGGLS
jgi:hypothetical protein